MRSLAAPAPQAMMAGSKWAAPPGSPPPPPRAFGEDVCAELNGTNYGFCEETGLHVCCGACHNVPEVSTTPTPTATPEFSVTVSAPVPTPEAGAPVPTPAGGAQQGTQQAGTQQAGTQQA